MPVDPAIQGLLSMLEALERPSLSAGTPQRARADFRMLTVDLRDPASMVEVAGVEDVEVDGADGPLPARIYRPAEAHDGPVPTVVFFHGGGFVIGDIDTHDNQCRWVCRDVGAVVVSVAYRLAPEARFPAAVFDCLAATRWAAEHISDLGDDPRRLALAGDSAGGNLAAVVAQACRDEGHPDLAAQLLIYPVVDARDDEGAVYASRVDNAEGYFLTADDMRWFHAHYVAGDVDAEHPHLSPLHGDLRDLPPAVVVTAEYDPLRDEGDEYAQALADAGVVVVHRRYDGMIHGFFDLPALSEAAAEAVRDTCAAFRDLLA